MDLQAYWSAVLRQDADEMRTYLHSDAEIRWHCTNELFTAEEFIRVNCEYPGAWAGDIEKEIIAGNNMITVTRVNSADHSFSFHVTSFFEVEDGKIRTVDEYWGDDGEAPLWRQELKLGCKIR